MRAIQTFRQWLVPKGLFHWVNSVCVLLLAFLGLIMTFRTELGLGGEEVKVAFKYIHSYVGFIFLINLLVRAFRRWRFGPANSISVSGPKLKPYFGGGFRAGKASVIEVRSASKLVILAIFALLTLSSITGVIRAGTDIYLPPLGPLVANWIAEDNAMEISPLSKKNINQQKHGKLNRIKVPVGLIHRWSAYLLGVLVVLHIFISSDLSIRRENK